MQLKQRIGSRKGPKIPNKPRQIIAQFSSATQAQEVYKNRFNRKDEQDGHHSQRNKVKVYINRDLSEETVKIQTQLRKVLKPAKKIDEDAHIVGDKLLFKKKVYNLENCYSLQELELEKIGSVQKANYVMFHGRFSPFSNFYPSPIVVDGKHYRCVEQFFQAEKARFLGKANAVYRILYSKDPVDMKSIGNKLDGEAWPLELQEAAMRKALLAKFGQNKSLSAFLKESRGKALIECNKHDLYWGNGRSIYDSKASQGKGRNRLGQLLEEVREILD